MLEDASRFSAIRADAKSAGLQIMLEIFKPFRNSLDRLQYLRTEAMGI